MAYVVQRLTAIAGQAPAGPALDFGCGTGRLAEAMTAHVSSVTGYDISPGMLAKARERGKATYVDALPDGPFGWINSFIVFQHIPPARGLDLIADLMARLAPGGMISLQLTIWREAHLVPAPPAPAPRFLRRLLRGLLRRPGPPAAPPGAIMMYDYELSAVTQVLHRAGVEELTLIHTDHGGHHGVIVLGRKAPA
jgi:SAM-dependent methyltransferase